MRYLFVLIMVILLATSAGSPLTVKGQLNAWGDGWPYSIQAGTPIVAGSAAFSDGSSNLHIFTFPSIGTNKTWNWLNSYGSPGDVLTGDGFGNFSWSTVGGSSPLTTKGDIYVYSTVNDRLPIGTNGQELQADSTTATGLKWVTPIVYTDEQAQDAIGAELIDTATIDFTYTDATPELKFDVINDSITFAKVQNIATDKILGRDTAGSGDIEELGLGTGLTISGGNLNMSVSAPTNATYITQTSDATLSAEQALSSLATGYMKVTTGTGVVTSQAVPFPMSDLAGTPGADRVMYQNGSGTFIDSDAEFVYDDLANDLQLSTVSYQGATSGETIVSAASIAGGNFILPKVNTTGPAVQATATNKYLVANTSGVQVYQTIDAGDITTGTLAIARGGTNATSFTTGSVFFFDGTSFAQDNTNFFFDSTSNAQFFKLGAGTSPAEFRFLEGSGGGVNYTSIKSPATLAGNTVTTLGSVTATLPTSQATATNKFLTSNTSGTWSFATVDGGDITTGTLATGRGGTGQGTWTSGSIVFSNATNSLGEDNSNFFFNPTANSQRLLIGGGTNPGEIRFKEGSGGGSNYTALKAPATLGGDTITTIPTVTTTFPTVQATATNKFATSNTSGTWSFATVDAGDITTGTLATGRGGTGQTLSGPRDHIIINASDFATTLTNGQNGGPAYSFTDTGATDYQYFQIVMPDNYDGGTITISATGFSTYAGTSGNGYFDIAAAQVADNTDLALGITYGTAQNVTSAMAASSGQRQEKFVFPALTPSGSPAGGTTLLFRWGRNTSNAADTFTTGKVDICSLKLEYGTNSWTE